MSAENLEANQSLVDPGDTPIMDSASVADASVDSQSDHNLPSPAVRPDPQVISSGAEILYLTADAEDELDEIVWDTSVVYVIGAIVSSYLSCQHQGKGIFLDLFLICSLIETLG